VESIEQDRDMPENSLLLAIRLEEDFDFRGLLTGYEITFDQATNDLVMTRLEGAYARTTMLLKGIRKIGDREWIFCFEKIAIQRRTGILS
jgi:hypothetical protein